MVLEYMIFKRLFLFQNEEEKCQVVIRKSTEWFTVKKKQWKKKKRRNSELEQVSFGLVSFCER